MSGDVDQQQYLLLDRSSLEIHMRYVVQYWKYLKYQTAAIASHVALTRAAKEHFSPLFRQVRSYTCVSPDDSFLYETHVSHAVREAHLRYALWLQKTLFCDLHTNAVGLKSPFDVVELLDGRRVLGPLVWRLLVWCVRLRQTNCSKDVVDFLPTKNLLSAASRAFDVCVCGAHAERFVAAHPRGTDGRVLLYALHEYTKSDPNGQFSRPLWGVSGRYLFVRELVSPPRDAYWSTLVKTYDVVTTVEAVEEEIDKTFGMDYLKQRIATAARDLVPFDPLRSNREPIPNVWGLPGNVWILFLVGCVLNARSSFVADDVRSFVEMFEAIADDAETTDACVSYQIRTYLRSAVRGSLPHSPLVFFPLVNSLVFTASRARGSACDLLEDVLWSRSSR